MLGKILLLLDHAKKHSEKMEQSVVDGINEPLGSRLESRKVRMKRKRPVGKKKPGRKIKAAAAVVMVLVAGCLAFTGCQSEKEDDKKLEDLEFTVVGEKDTPQTLQEMIAKKKTNPFKLTYADGQDMYIVIGEGPQEGGGFSIAVKELFRTENSVVIKTELMGPEPGESGGTETSYPVLIVKTVFCEEPVVFR